MGQESLGCSSTFLDRDRLEYMLSSKDKEMMRLAQLICHEYRISYYILANRRYDSNGFHIYVLSHFSLYPGKWIETHRHFHKVDLSKTKKVCRK